MCCRGAPDAAAVRCQVFSSNGAFALEFDDGSATTIAGTGDAKKVKPVAKKVTRVMKTAPIKSKAI